MNITPAQKYEIYVLIALNMYPTPKRVPGNSIDHIINQIERILNGQDPIMIQDINEWAAK